MKGRMDMKIGIISADIDEITPILSEMEITRTLEKAMLKICEGTICGKEVVALYCGACKVNAALATQLLIDLFKVDAVLNVGVAGGMDPKGRRACLSLTGLKSFTR